MKPSVHGTIQSSILISHVLPDQPGLHMQLKAFVPSTHVPLLKQGWFLHSSMFSSQFVPLKPG